MLRNQGYNQEISSSCMEPQIRIRRSFSALVLHGAKAGREVPRGYWQITYLENLFKIRPAGVVSKKLIGDRKIAYAMRSCSFREA
jgi:hypothetical protein